MPGTIDQLIVNGPYSEPGDHWRAVPHTPSDLAHVVHAVVQQGYRRYSGA